MNTIQDLLYSSIRAHHAGRALFSSEDKTGISYSALYDLSARAAGYLQSKGLKPGDCVVIALNKSLSYIIAELACLLFGYGAVLMDSAYPKERIDYAAEDTGAKLIIDSSLMNEMSAYPQQAQYRQLPEDIPAAIIYTSGSTGKPKGILHDQASLGSAVLRNLALLKPTKEDVAGLVAPFTFIAGCVAMLNPLCAGACATIIPRDVVANPLVLAEFIAQNSITWTYMPPGVLKVFKPASASLRMVTTGSERVSGIFSQSFQIYNIYGMSETCSSVAAFCIDKAYGNTPVGKAMDGCSIYLLDENNCKSTEGEICAAGHFMRGYIGMPEKTAEVKIKNPFLAEDGHKYLIRTGDLGRLDENGNLIYVNRKDWMIKINGQRVEPGEIESILKSLPQIADCAVKGFVNARGQNYLCAYYVKRDEVQEDILRLSISKQLPAYMMPARFIELEAMPRNANGKLDRLALPEPELSSFASDYAAPTNELEERLCRAMAEALGLERIGIHDDFFHLGGDSITCMDLISRMDDPRIGTRLIYSRKTPAAIAAALNIDAEEDMDEANCLALSQDQPLIPYQIYYLDYQFYSPKLVVTNLPFICSVSKGRINAQALKKAVDRVTQHFAIFGTMFLYNDNNELMQRYCPEQIPEIEICETSEAAFQTEGKRAFIRPFRMLNSILWRGKIVVTEENVHLLLDYSHAIADGTMAMRVFHQIFEALQGHELQNDYYYLFLHRYARFMETPEAAAELDLLRKTYDESWSRFPKPDFDVRENSNQRLVAITAHTAGAYQAAAAAKNISLGTALVAAGLLALSRFNEQQKTAVEWIYNGRDEKWKENLIGITISGIPAAIDFSKYTSAQAILAEAKRQNELGLRYAQYSYALRDMSPTKNECLKIVYEHGIAAPENMPEGFNIISDTGHYNGMLGLFQIIIFEGAADAPLTLIAVYQGTRYRNESAAKLLAGFEGALNELLL